MKRIFEFFSNSCQNLTNFANRDNQKNGIKQTRTEEEMDSDIESLNKAVEMNEIVKMNTRSKPSRPKSIRVKPKQTPPSIPETNNYVAMDPNSEPTQEEAEEWFIWELIRFQQRRSWKKKILTFLIVGVSSLVLFDLVFLGYIMKFITFFLEWMTYHPMGAVTCFLLFFVAATFVFVPPTILIFGAGYAFSDVSGVWPGVLAAAIVCFIGSALGAILAFLRSRYMMRDMVELFANRYPIVKAADTALKKKGLRVMILLRLCPIVPFNGLNYIGGVTSVSLEEYTFALIGILPNILLWVFVGASADHVRNTEIDGRGEFIVLILMLSTGVIFACAGLVLLYRYARDELRLEIQAHRAEDWLHYTKVEAGTKKEKIKFHEEDPEVTEGFEAMETPAGVLAILGIDNLGVETAQIPAEDAKDEDWLWVWV